MDLMPNPLTERLNRAPLAAFPTMYRELEAPTLGQLVGTHRSAFVGPAWLRSIAPPGLALGGLGGWWGKRFDASGSGVNLVMHSGKPEAILPVRLEFRSSRVDARTTACVLYPPESRWPWPHVLDELRVLEPGCLLGLTFFQIGVFSNLPLPFMLLRQD
jgi:hypothetical protein